MRCSPAALLKWSAPATKLPDLSSLGTCFTEFYTFCLSLRLSLLILLLPFASLHHLICPVFFYFFEVLLKPLREIWGQSCLLVICWLASEFNCGNAERFTRWTTQLECFGCEAAFAVPLFTCSHYLIRSSPRPFECNVSLSLSHSPLYTYLSVPSCKFFSNFLSISHLAKLQENLASF